MKKHAWAELIFSVSIVVILLEIVHFLIGNNLSFDLNDQLIFGTWGNNIVAIILSFVLLLIVLAAFFKEKIGLTVTVLILSGGVTNIIDRFVYHGSVDYIRILFIPSFNLADTLIVLGVTIFVLSKLHGPKRLV